MAWMRSLCAVAALPGVAGGLLWLADSPAAWNRPIRRGEKQYIAVRAPAGSVVAATVDQWEIDLKLSAECPGQSPVHGGDRGPYGRETLLFPAPPGGADCRMVVEADPKGAFAGAFQVRTLDVRRVAPADRAGLQGQELFVRASQLDQQARTDSQEQARQAYAASAPLFRAGGLPMMEGLARMLEGRALDRAGLRDAAYSRYAEALRIYERAGDEYGRIETLLKIGRLTGHLQRQFDFVPDDRGFLLAWLKLGDRRGVAHAMSVLSGAYRRKQKDFKTAGKWARESIELARQLGDMELEARCLESLIAVQFELGELDAALRNSFRKRALYIEAGDERGESATLGLIGRILFESGRYAEAVPYLMRQAELKQRQGDPTAAADALWGLANAYLKLGDMESVDATAKREIALSVSLAERSMSPQYRSALLSAPPPFEGRTQHLLRLGRAGDALANVDGLRARAFGLRAGREEPLPGEELDRDSVLLETLTGRTHTYVWVAGADGVRSYLAPPSPVITPLALRVRNCFAERKECAAEAQELSRMLLRPAWPQIRGKRLVVAGDGILSYFPFGALPDPSRSDGAPILMEQEVVLVPSFSVMAALRKQAGPMGELSHVTALADPVYDAQDPRMRVKPAQSGYADLDLIHAMKSSGLDPARHAIPRLWHAASEVRGLMDALPPRVRRTALTGFDATREAFLKPVPRGSILHVATHGVVSEDDPDLSGLVFSRWDRAGRSVPGYVRLHDISARSIPARLVVLSACQTACGRQYFGQGAFSLASGFLRAGARSVVASSWNVNDAATEELMKAFYRRLLADRELRVPRALRAAQLELLSSPQWSHPYFWAGFSAYGEWR